MKEKMSEQKIVWKKYTSEFNDRALALTDKVWIPLAAEDLGIPTEILYSWRKERNQWEQPLENKKIQEAKLMLLKRENLRL